MLLTAPRIGHHGVEDILRGVALRREIKEESTMNVGAIVLGVCLVVASILAFWIALPRDGQVRWFLRNDYAQAYYAVSTLGLLSWVSPTSSRAWSRAWRPDRPHRH